MSFATAEGEEHQQLYKRKQPSCLMMNFIESLHTDHGSHSQSRDSELFHMSSGYLMHKSKRDIKTANGKSFNGLSSGKILVICVGV